MAPPYISEKKPIAVVDALDTSQPGAAVVEVGIDPGAATSPPVAPLSGLVVIPAIGYASHPVRTDPVGTTVQPVSVVSGGGINSSVGATGAAAPANATLVGVEDASGNLQPFTPNLGVALHATGQVTVANTSTLIIAANAARAVVIITNTHATLPMYIGATGVTITTGHYVAPGVSIGLPVVSAIYGVVSASTLVATYLELQ